MDEFESKMNEYYSLFMNASNDQCDISITYRIYAEQMGKVRNFYNFIGSELECLNYDV